MSTIRTHNASPSAFIEAIVSDAIAYYKKNDEKGLDSLLHKALSPILLSGSGLSDSTTDFEMKENVLTAAIAQYKEKKQEDIILRKAFTALSVSKSASGEDFSILKEEIIGGAIKNYQQNQQNNLVLISIMFAILSCQLPKLIKEDEEKIIQKRVGSPTTIVKLTDILSTVQVQGVWDKEPVEEKKIEKTVTEISTGYSESDKEEVQRLQSNVAKAVNEIVFRKDKYLLFEDTLLALKGTRRFDKAINDGLAAIQVTFDNKADDVLDLTQSTEIMLDEVIKLFYPHPEVIPGTISEKYENLTSGVKAGYGLYAELVAQLVIPQAIAGQAQTFLKEYSAIFLKFYPHLTPLVQVCLNDVLVLKEVENRLEVYETLMNDDVIPSPGKVQASLKKQKAFMDALSNQKIEATTESENKATYVSQIKNTGFFALPVDKTKLISVPKPVVVEERKRPSLERKPSPYSPKNESDLPPSPPSLSQKSFISTVNDISGDARKYTVKAVDKTVKMAGKLGRAIGSYFS